jgi:K+-sensing histidine kinase KdpD
MKKIQYNSILLFITISLVATFGLQIYWNIKNYDENKKNIYNEVVQAFDKSIEYYYLEDLKNDNIVIINSSSLTDKVDFENINLDSILNVKKPKGSNKKRSDNYLYKTSKKIRPFKSEITILKGKKLTDSVLRLKQYNSVSISIKRDSINLLKISKGFTKELNRKKLTVNYKIEQFNFKKRIQVLDVSNQQNYEFSAFSNSIDIPKGDQLKIYFSSDTFAILQRSSVEILISILLSMLLLGCVFYLLKIINDQKKIAEIKNDFISNISHELKTPIAIASTAIEGIERFNTENDVQKTKKYLKISHQELQKLNVMVERILETASLESKELTIKKEPTDLVLLIQKCVEKVQISTQKDIHFETNYGNLLCAIDPFHFENVISNMIENAIK